MSETPTKFKTLPLYAAPSDEQLIEWHSLSREEQIASFQKAIDEAKSSEPVEDFDPEALKLELMAKYNLNIV